MAKGMKKAVVAALLLGGSYAVKIDSAVAEAKARPVTKVVNMLQDMQENLEKEKKEDEDMYEDIQCWCKDNKAGKATEVKDAEAKIAQLQSSADELNASAESLATEMAGLAKEVKEATATLDKARVMYGNEVEKFNADEKSLYKDIEAVESAETVLGGGEGALMQMPEGRLQEVAAAVQDAVNRRATLLDNTLSFRDRDNLDAFFKDPVAFVKNPALLQTDEPIGGELSGMFKAMEEDFKVDLKTVQDEMAKSKQTYEELMATKKEEIKAGEANIESKRQQRVEKRQNMIEMTHEIKDMKKSIASATEFLALVEEKCGTSDEEWVSRQKKRQEEIEGVAKAIEVLDGEEAHATFSRTYSFIQEATADNRLKRASAVLQQAARSQGDARLQALAATAEVKGMEKVIAAIDEMKEAMKKEQQDEVAQKDFCTASFNDVEAKKAEVAATKEKHSAQLAKLETKLNTVAGDISEVKGKITTAQKDLQAETDDHQKELKDFEVTLADQKSTQKLLKKAMESLKKVYMEKPAGTFVQVAGPDDKAPEGFKEYKQSGQGNAVLTLMQTVISDTQAMQKETERAKTDATKDYDKLAAATNKDISTMSKELDNRESVKAKAMSDLSAAKVDLKGSDKQLVDLAKEEADLHESCDFLLKNFELRKAARTEELEGLAKAKSILSGGSFLQK
eukprot:gb/GFBE01006726.1/.p1 GENE.gb/GFBE01006726.1/~~gb/GFBE01006726.1/.p1  ORF type:complete len:680 (+),score=331.38 gb/GFBE01006726.1/:1-2040(+)